jgi:hypothetical protein
MEPTGKWTRYFYSNKDIILSGGPAFLWRHTIISIPESYFSNSFLEINEKGGEVPNLLNVYG